MSKTRRREPREQKEREFPYIPKGVPVYQIGRPYGPDDNRAYVRSLMRTRYPRTLEGYDAAVGASCGEGCVVAR